MSEADVIARLYRQIKELEEERDAVLFTYNQADKECAELRKMAARAAEALETHSIAIAGEVRDLIAELRKAAQ
jgi:hypothetical protein